MNKQIKYVIILDVTRKTMETDNNSRVMKFLERVIIFAKYYM